MWPVGFLVATSVLLSISVAQLFEQPGPQLALQPGEEDYVLKQQYPFYHTTAEIHQELNRLTKACGGAASMRTVTAGDVSIDVVTIRQPGTDPRNKVFILFGEHSLELIGPESGLHLLRALCGEVSVAVSPGTALPSSVLQTSQFQIVLNANPRSRLMVERGNFCVRMNPDNVDLNRNWGGHWEEKAVPHIHDTNPGPKPFSERETQILRDLVTNYQPTVFLTVHSGTRSMYMPWAYAIGPKAMFNRLGMIDVLRAVDKDHCKCPFGAAGDVIGYPCPGTSLDWIYANLRTPFAFAFEIFGDPSLDQSLEDTWKKQLNAGGRLLLQSGAPVNVTSSEAEKCFSNNNPGTKELYDATVTNWAAAYLQIAQLCSIGLNRAMANATNTRLLL